MMYDIQSHSISSDIDVITLRNTATAESVTLCPSLGGTVLQIILATPCDTFELLSTDSTQELCRNPLFRGRILFPWNDRIPQGRYSFEGKTFTLPINVLEDNSAIHGLIYNRPTDILNSQVDPDAASLTFRSRIVPSDEPGYPFSVELQTTCRLSPGTLSMAFRMTNRGLTPAPMALGWHPYFRISSPDTTLQAACTHFVEVTADLLPTGNLCEVTGELDFHTPQRLTHQALDKGFLAPRDGVTTLDCGTHRVVLRQERDLFAYTQLYLPEDRQSIAIEPITAATNSFNIPHLGLQILCPGETRSGAVCITVSST